MAKVRPAAAVEALDQIVRGNLFALASTRRIIRVSRRRQLCKLLLLPETCLIPFTRSQGPRMQSLLGAMGTRRWGRRFAEGLLESIRKVEGRQLLPSSRMASIAISQVEGWRIVEHNDS